MIIAAFQGTAFIIAPLVNKLVDTVDEVFDKDGRLVLVRIKLFVCEVVIGTVLVEVEELVLLDELVG